MNPYLRNRRRLKQLTIILAVLWLVMALFVLLAWAAGMLAGEAPRLPGELWAWTVTGWLPWLAFAPLVLFLSTRHGVHAPRRRNSLILHLAILASLVTVHVLAAVYAYPLVAVTPTAEALEIVMLLFFDKGYLLVDALIYITLASAENLRYYRELVRQREWDALRLDKNLTESRLKTLQMQLNPHFLFNTLNSLSVLIEKSDTELAGRMTARLSNFLRQTLNNSGEKWVSLNKELDLVRGYLGIEEIRFGERLTYYEECEPIALSAKVPPMLLQPLFENAIVHGLADKEGECRLGFECRVHDRRLFILISDNGEGFDAANDPGHGSGVGLANVEARLREVYGENYSFSLERNPAGGTLVHLRIPAYKDSYF